MNRLNSIALLAGGALVAVAATGCASNAAKSAASGSAATSSASSPNASGAPSTMASSAPSAASSSAPAGGSSSAPSAAPTGHPICDNAKLNASLAPAVAGQKTSVAVIAVKNVGPTCTVGPIPYVWIVTSPTDVSNETRPQIPATDSSRQLIILSGTTLYAAIDLNPNSAANAAGSYGYLEVTANPTKNTSGKDVQDVQLPAAANVAGAMLGVYTTNPHSAIDQIRYATTPEQ